MPLMKLHAFAKLLLSPSIQLAATVVPELADLPQPNDASSADGYDLEMLKDELRPLVEDEVRLEVDEDMRRTIAKIKVSMVKVWLI